MILNHGAILQAFYLPDGRNVTLGFETWDGYAKDTKFMGRLIGRNANRIEEARFQIYGQTSVLIANDGTDNLHSGPDGFDAQVWEVTRLPSGLELRHQSPDGHDGFPGEVQTLLKISLNKGKLRLDMEAKTSKATPVNLTWHPYWNLTGFGRIDGHDLQVIADERTQFHTPDPIELKNTRFDFRRGHPIGSIRLDENFRETESVTLTSNRVKLRVTSSLPGMQIYTGDQLDSPRAGIAVEPQFRPNDINLEQESLLHPGETYRHWIEYAFDLD